MTQDRTTEDDEGQGGRANPGSGDAPTGDRASPWGRLGTLGAAVLVFGAFIVLALMFAALPNVAAWAIKLDSVVLLIAGFVTVTLILYTGTVVMTALGMPTPGEALGMPPGSIRALIAMVLILIFAIIGVVVLQSSTSGDVYTSEGLTQTQIDSIRAGGGNVLEQDLMPATGPGATPAEPLYTVRIRQRMSAEGHDFALQLLTTVSTLVVAVAGFYFGSKNLGTGAAAALAARAPVRTPQEVVPTVPDASRDEDPGDADTTPATGSPDTTPAGGSPDPAAGGGGAPPPVAPPGVDGTVETADSLDDVKPDE